VTKVIAFTGLGRIGSELWRRNCVHLGIDICDRNAVRKRIAEIQPDLIIHNAAITNVTTCEQNENRAFQVNVTGTANIAQAAENIPVIYLSSDHVFDGNSSRPPAEHLIPKPKNVYGFTKLGGEVVLGVFGQHSLIVRTSKLFTLTHITNQIIQKANENKPFMASNLLRRSFMYLPDFVSGLLYLAENFDRLSLFVPVPKTQYNRILHYAGDASISYFQFYRQVLRVFGYDEELVQPRNFEPENETARPLRGGLNSSRAWKLGLPKFSLLAEILQVQEELT